MSEEIKARQTAEETSAVESGQRADTGSARYDAERKPMLSCAAEDGAEVTTLDAVSELLGSKKIPSLGAVEMLALLHHLFNAADPPLRFQIAEVVYRYDHDHPNGQDLFLACTQPSAEKAARRSTHTPLRVTPTNGSANGTEGQSSILTQ